MSESPAPAVTHRADGDVAVITIDDGKANAFSHQVIDSVHAALDASADAGAVVLAGRPGRFSAGFDLATMKAGPADARDLLAAGAELALRIFELPVPTVAACTGHALAMGAITLFAFDVRIGEPGAYKIGMNEVAIGMPVPRFAIELASDRLSRRHLTQATALAHIYDPIGAVDAGYLDRLAANPVAEAVAEAQRLAGYVSRSGFVTTRTFLRHGAAERSRAGLAIDVTEFALGNDTSAA